MNDKVLTVWNFWTHNNICSGGLGEIYLWCLRWCERGPCASALGGNCISSFCLVPQFHCLFQLLHDRYYPYRLLPISVWVRKEIKLCKSEGNSKCLPVSKFTLHPILSLECKLFGLSTYTVFHKAMKLHCTCIILYTNFGHAYIHVCTCDILSHVPFNHWRTLSFVFQRLEDCKTFTASWKWWSSGNPSSWCVDGAHAHARSWSRSHSLSPGLRPCLWSFVQRSQACSRWKSQRYTVALGNHDSKAPISASEQSVIKNWGFHWGFHDDISWSASIILVADSDWTINSATTQ